MTAVSPTSLCWPQPTFAKWRYWDKDEAESQQKLCAGRALTVLGQEGPSEAQCGYLGIKSVTRRRRICQRRSVLDTALDRRGIVTRHGDAANQARLMAVHEGLDHVHHREMTVTGTCALHRDWPVQYMIRRSRPSRSRMVIFCPSTAIRPWSRKVPSTLFTLSRVAATQVASSD